MKASRRFLHQPIQMQQAEGSEPFFSPSSESIQTKQEENVFSASESIATPTIQPKLSVNAPGDEHEKEADAMADKVVQRMAAPEKEEDKIHKKGTDDIHRKCDNCEEEEKVQRKADGSGGGVAPNYVTQQINASKGGGTALNDKTRGDMESSFGTDFSNVRIHNDSQAADLSQNLNAHAFTHGSDIYFNEGKFSPESSDGQRLLAHELTHVVQQGGGVERKIQRDFLGLGDFLNLRENEAELDTWEDYQSSIEEKTEFLNNIHSSESFYPSTGGGRFKAYYLPQQNRLLIKVTCNFNFVNGSSTQYPDAALEAITWTDDEKMSWKTRFLQIVSQQWTSANFRFHCQRNWWEDLTARVDVSFEEDPVDAFYDMEVMKIPVGSSRTSQTTNRPHGRGLAELDSNDLEMTTKPGGEQIPAVHESGHILGLGDEYGTGTPRHSASAVSQLGVPQITRGADDRIMSGGMRMGREHGVTFLEALKSITNIQEWNDTINFPAPIPRDPNRPNLIDTNTYGPQSDTQYA